MRKGTCTRMKRKQNAVLYSCEIRQAEAKVVELQINLGSVLGSGVNWDEKTRGKLVASTRVKSSHTSNPSNKS